MFAHYFRKSVGCRVSVIRLEGDQRGCTERKVVEIDLGYILRISRIGIGNNPLGAGTGNEPERGKRCLATHGVVQVGSGAEEGQPRLVHGCGSEGLGVTHDKLLGTGWGLGRKTGHAGATARQRAEDSRIVEVIIERPIASLLVVKIYPFPDLVVGNGIPVAVVFIRSCAGIDVGRWNVREDTDRGWRPRTLRNYAAREYALRGRGTANKGVWLAGCDRVAQSIGKRRRPVEAGPHGAGAGGQRSCIDGADQS